MVGREALGYSLRHPGLLKQRLAVAAFEDDRVLGTMVFGYRLTDNLDTVEVDVAVPPQHRRRGIGTALWQWAVTRSAQLGRTIVQAEARGAVGAVAGSGVRRRLGFTVEHVEEHLVVPLPYDEFRLAELVESAGSLDGYRLTSWADVPAGTSAGVRRSAHGDGSRRTDGRHDAGSRAVDGREAAGE